jgi:hypothetical protein
MLLEEIMQFILTMIMYLTRHFAGKTQFLNVKADGTYTYHCDLKG